MRILLIGKVGQVSWELLRTLAPLGEVVSFDFPEIDLADIAQTRALVQQTRPQVVVNAAAYTNVDRAEGEANIAQAVNGIAPGILAEEARKVDAVFIHYSTDFVFDGQKGTPYIETDLPNPINIYGRTKLEGEQVVEATGGAYLILRTSWVYSMRQGGFVTKVLSWAEKNETLHIVSDQVGSPTWARMLAEVTAQVIAKGGVDIYPWLLDRRGIYHCAGSGAASRLDWAKAILSNAPGSYSFNTKEILSAKSADFPTPAIRPAYSALDCQHFTRIFGLRLPNWKDCLQMAMDAG